MHLLQDDEARHDDRRAARIEARHAACVARQACSPAAGRTPRPAPRAAHRRLVHARRVVHLHALVDAHHTGGRAGNRHQAARARSRPHARVGEERPHARAHPRARAAPLRRSLGGSAEKNRSVTRRHPMSNERDLKAIGARPRAARTTSVEPPPTSTTSRSSPAKSPDSAAERQRRLALARARPRASTPCAAKQLRRTRRRCAHRAPPTSPWPRISTEGCSAVRKRWSKHRWKPADGLRHPLHGLRASRTPDAFTPSPRFVMAYSRSSSCRPDASTSATSMRHVTVPMSMAA